MTRKDYVALAASIMLAYKAHSPKASCHLLDHDLGVEAAAHRIADALEADNPRFDRRKFLAASGVYL